jgi:hypothetical protein
MKDLFFPPVFRALVVVLIERANAYDRKQGVD